MVRILNENYLIETVNLSKSFKKRKIINKLNIKVESGDIYGYLGPNGSGKTTTIRMLLGLIFPDEGSIFINGYDINTDFKKAISVVGATVESPSFYQYLSGYENLKIMSNLYPVPINRSKIEELLEFVHLTKSANDKVQTYSLGMKQRLGIALALLNDPKIIILDEPTNGLDPQGMSDLKTMISNLSSERGISFFISSHLIRDIEQVCTKVGIIKEGELLVQGKLKELINLEYDIVDINCVEKVRVHDILKDISMVKSFYDTQKGFRLEIDKGQLNAFKQLLSNNNIAPEAIISQDSPLENLFFRYTNGGYYND